MINELQIALKENNVDISLITETHLSSNSKFKIFGYDCLQTNHPDNSRWCCSYYFFQNPTLSFSSYIKSKHAASRYVCEYKIHTYFNSISNFLPSFPLSAENLLCRVTQCLPGKYVWNKHRSCRLQQRIS